HFFSPANVMKLLENVRGSKTSDEGKATVMAVAKKINKVGVLVGSCYGFVGNRMLHKRGAEAMSLVNEGATPQQVDKVLTDLGYPMGQFAMSDLAGVDVGYRIREERRKNGEDVPPTWMDKLFEKVVWARRPRLAPIATKTAAAPRWSIRKWTPSLRSSVKSRASRPVRSPIRKSLSAACT